MTNTNTNTNENKILYEKEIYNEEFDIKFLITKELSTDDRFIYYIHWNITNDSFKTKYSTYELNVKYGYSHSPFGWEDDNWVENYLISENLEIISNLINGIRCIKCEKMFKATEIKNSYCEECMDEFQKRYEELEKERLRKEKEELEEYEQYKQDMSDELGFEIDDEILGALNVLSSLSQEDFIKLWNYNMENKNKNKNNT